MITKSLARFISYFCFGVFSLSMMGGGLNLSKPFLFVKTIEKVIKITHCFDFVVVFKISAFFAINR